MINKNYMYRGLTLESNNWVYGYLVEIYSCYPEESEFTIIYPGQSYPPRINQNSICHQLGLMDAEGEEIYEKDILEDLDGNYWEVTWDQETASWCLRSGEKTKLISREFLETTRVISNVFDR